MGNVSPEQIKPCQPPRALKLASRQPIGPDLPLNELIYLENLLWDSSLFSVTWELIELASENRRKSPKPEIEYKLDR